MGLASLLAGGPLCARPTPLIGKGHAQHQRAKWPEPAVVVTVSEWRDRAHWVYLPEWLIDALEDLCPLEDRTPERRVFQGITEASAYQTMLRACRTAGVPRYHPHDLRHRRITVWHQSGVVARELAERAGHARASITLDVYSHVMPLSEAAAETLAALAREMG